MRAKKVRNFYLLRLIKGEEILTTLKDFLTEKKIKGGIILGIGAGKEFTIGYYDLKRKHYFKKFIPEECEIVSLLGNISVFEDDIFIHCHILLALPTFTTIGGHLFSGVITATAEFFILPSPVKILRQKSEEIGLNLLDL
jgi:predicted DNA-binding protein with PD1-like motif